MCVRGRALRRIAGAGLLDGGLVMHRLQHVLRSLHLVGAPPDASVLDVARRMCECRVGAIAILDGEDLVGILSERDLMQRVVVPGRDAAATPVSEVMTRDVVTAALDETVDASLAKMQKAGCRHLPVVESGRILSMVSMRDLLRDELEEQGEEIRHLRAYLHQAPH
jgi:CBS domain-containing protein